jgi:predicted DNA-binding protein (UPF0251 family)
MVGAWRAFLALHAARTMHAAGPNPITWPDLEAYQRMAGVVLARYEIEAIRSVDVEFLVQHAASMKQRTAMK